MINIGSTGDVVLMPVQTRDRHSADSIELTSIGKFGLLRKPRKNILSHYHTGIDIKRPNQNYVNEPVYPIAPGRVISRRDDGPYAQLIIEHQFRGMHFWTLYEHLAGILVPLNAEVSPDAPIGRFMNRDELNRYGWQFDHVHFEVLRLQPILLQPSSATPARHFSSYSLICFSQADLAKYFYDPLEFLTEKAGP